MEVSVHTELPSASSTKYLLRRSIVFFIFNERISNFFLTSVTAHYRDFIRSNKREKKQIPIENSISFVIKPT